MDEFNSGRISEIHIHPPYFTCSNLTLTIFHKNGTLVIALGYGLDDRRSRVRFPAGAGNFSLHHRVLQNDSEAHPASYPMDTRGSFSGGKMAGT
jgi:hypothetical protein